MSFIAGAYRLKLTPAWPGAKEFDAGATSDGFHLTIERLGDEITADELGKIVVDGIEGGISVEFEVVHLEWSEELLAAVLYPYASKPDAKELTHLGVGSPGMLWSAYALKAVLDPIRKPSVKRTFWQARCVEPMELLLSGIVPAKIPCRFIVLPDLAQKGKEFMQSDPVTR